jgi:hypothetical protein
LWRDPLDRLTVAIERLAQKVVSESTMEAGMTIKSDVKAGYARVWRG